MFESTFLYPWNDLIRLVWYFQAEDLEADPEFLIDKSIDGGSTWTTLNSLSAVDGYLYDTSLLTSHFSNDTYYRITASLTGIDDIVSDNISGTGNWDTREFRKMARAMDQELDRLKTSLTGVSGYLVRRRRSGVSCTSCLDAVTGVVMDVNCETCYGTGIVGGFYPSLASRVDYLKLADYRKRWHSLTGSYSSEALVIRIPAIGPWLEGDVWEDTSSTKRYLLSSEFEAAVSSQGVPLIYEGIIDRVSTDDVIQSFDTSSTL